MSHLGETASSCLALLKKHEPAADRIEGLRVSPAVLRAVAAQGFEVRQRGEFEPLPGRLGLRGRPRNDQPPALARLVAVKWLDQPKPRAHSQRKMAKAYGLTQSNICAAVATERNARRLAHRAGDTTALLAGRRKAGSLYGQGTTLAQEFLADPKRWNSQTEFAAHKGIAISTLNSGIGRILAARAARETTEAAA